MPDTSSAAAPAASDVDEAGDEAAQTMPQGTFNGTTEIGTTYTAHVPGETPADIEAYRQKMGAEPVGYITLDVDNSAGSDSASPSGITLVDGDGNQLDYQSAFIPIGDWWPTMRDDGPEDKNDGYWYSMPNGTEISEDEYDSLYGEGNELYDAYLTDLVRPGAKTQEVFIGPAVPDQMLYVEVQDAMTPVALEPAS